MIGQRFEATCTNCGDFGTLVVVKRILDFRDTEIKYIVECETCGYKFSVIKEFLEDALAKKSEQEKSER